MPEDSQRTAWEAVQSLETINQELARAAAPLQDLHLNPTTKQQALAVQGECKALIVRLLEHFSSAQLEGEPADDTEALGKAVEEILDDVLERVDTSLDAARALLKAAKAPGPGTISAPEAGRASAARPVAGVRANGKGGFQAAHMDFSMGPRPQDLFVPPVDNSNEPFQPQLQPWQQALPDCPSLEPGDLPRMHPLQKRLAQLEYQPWQLEAPEPIFPEGLDEMQLTYVDSLLALQALARELSTAREIAVDLEAHSYRSFQGFCCLMQLSTRDADYLIDVLALRQFIGPCLGPIFADAKVVKVLHGSDSDVLWLQRDFGIYIVNLFDTGQAARVLGFPSAGLAYLLTHFCGVKADKRWQMADWRVRPLSKEALLYARMDTHYLLYIYDRIKVELADVPTVPDHLLPELPAGGPVTMIGVVLERSRRLCLQHYQKELLTPTTYLEAYLRGGERLSRPQLSVFAGLFAWRDRVARERDESMGFIMPKILLMKLVKNTPKTTRELLNLLGINGRRSSPVVAELAAEVVQIITTATQNPESVPEPDQAVAFLKRFFSPAAEAAPLLQAPGTQTVETDAAARAINASGIAETAVVQMAGPPLGISQNPAALLLPKAIEDGETGKTRAAAENKPRLPSLQPKAIPSLSLGPQRSCGLFRQAPNKASMFHAAAMHAVRSPSQQLEADSPATSAVEAALPAAAPAAGQSSAAVPSTSRPLAASAQAGFDVPTAPGPSNMGMTEEGAGQPLLQQPARAAKVQGIALQGEPTALRSIFSTSKRARPAAVLGMPSNAQVAGSTADKAAVLAQLKAQLALPFISTTTATEPQTAQLEQGDLAAAAAEGAAAGDTRLPGSKASGGREPQALQKTSGAAIRSLMEDMKSENPFDMLNAPLKEAQPEPASNDDPDEYLPLPISEAYQLPSKRRRRSSQDARPQTACSEHGPGSLAAKQAALIKAGLESGNEDEEGSEHSGDSSWDVERSAASIHNPKNRDAVKRQYSPQDAAADEEAAEQRPLGPVFPRQEKPAKARKVSKAALPSAVAQGSKAQQPSIPYDFAAAKAAARGLDVSALMGLPAQRKPGHKRGAARGASSKGRPEKDSDGLGRLSLGGAAEGDGKKRKKQKGFDPYSNFEANEIRGGKHSNIMHKMGNRSMTFN